MSKTWLKKWWGVPAGVVFLIIGFAYAAMSLDAQRAHERAVSVDAARIAVRTVDRLQSDRFAATGRYAATLADLAESDGDADGTLAALRVMPAVTVSESARTIMIRAQAAGATVTVLRRDGTVTADTCTLAHGGGCAPVYAAETR